MIFFFKLSMMVVTAQFYILIPVLRAFAFSQGHRVKVSTCFYALSYAPSDCLSDETYVHIIL